MHTNGARVEQDMSGQTILTCVDSDKQAYTYRLVSQNKNIIIV